MYFDSSAFLLGADDGAKISQNPVLSMSGAGTSSSTTGLGFTKKKKKHSEADDALAQRLLNQHKKAKKLQQQQISEVNDNDGLIGHGGVSEDEDELLRAKTAGLKSKKAQISAATTIPGGNEGSKKVSKNERETSVKQKTAIKGTAPPLVSDDTKDYSEKSAFAEGTAEEDTGPYKRKRIKTRSKQKNIRRDKRAEDAKPEFIRRGEGRPLTEETRLRLGMTPALIDTNLMLGSNVNGTVGGLIGQEKHKGEEHQQLGGVEPTGKQKKRRKRSKIVEISWEIDNTPSKIEE